MDIGVSLHPRIDQANAVDDILEQADRAQRAGLTRVWLGQRLSHDALGLASLIGHSHPELRVGTSVVPINPRHPLTLASQAQTAQAASHGRFTLGLGLGSPKMERESFGITADRQIGVLREYLTVLRGIIDHGTVTHHGEHYTAAPNQSPAVAGGTPLPILVAAMGPQALRVTAELADGTLPYLAGPRTIADHIVPILDSVTGARPQRIVAGLPAVLTNDPDRVRARARAAMELYATNPSYQRVVSREGLDHPVDLALIGDEKTLTEGLRRYADAGAGEVFIAQTDLDGVEAQQRTWEFLASISDG